MYSIWASETCALPSRLLACWAKMSRISAVRSMTLTLTTSSSWLSWPGVSSPSQITVSAPVATTRSRSSRALPEPMYVAASGLSRRWISASSTWEPAVSASAASSRQRVLGVLRGALGPDPDQHDPLEAQLPVLDLGDVLELGGQAGDPAQRLPVGEVVLLAVVVARVGLVERSGGVRDQRRGVEVVVEGRSHRAPG